MSNKDQKIVKLHPPPAPAFFSQSDSGSGSKEPKTPGSGSPTLVYTHPCTPFRPFWIPYIQGCILISIIMCFAFSWIILFFPSMKFDAMTGHSSLTKGFQVFFLVLSCAFFVNSKRKSIFSPLFSSFSPILPLKSFFLPHHVIRPYFCTPRRVEQKKYTPDKSLHQIMKLRQFWRYKY